MVTIERASVSFHEPVLIDLDLTVTPHETFGILGPSGAGKTVLLKSIAALIPLSSGTRKVSTSRYTMTFQRSGLFDSMSAERNLSFVLEEAGIPRREHGERIGAALEEVGLANQGRLYPHELSGGMQKRLGIARALLLRPELVLFDDPTAGLDPVTSRTITDLIQAMKEKYQMTVLLTTSDLRVAYRLSTRLGFLYRGKFQATGSVPSLQSSEDPAVRQFLRGELEGPLTGDPNEGEASP